METQAGSYLVVQKSYQFGNVWTFTKSLRGMRNRVGQVTLEVEPDSRLDSIPHLADSLAKSRG